MSGRRNFIANAFKAALASVMVKTSEGSKRQEMTVANHLEPKVRWDEATELEKPFQLELKVYANGKLVSYHDIGQVCMRLGDTLDMTYRLVGPRKPPVMERSHTEVSA